MSNKQIQVGKTIVVGLMGEYDETNVHSGTVITQADLTELATKMKNAIQDAIESDSGD